MIKRTSTAMIREVIEKDNKMAFVSGPRQVGKTTFAKRYYCRDRLLHRQMAEL